MPKLLPERSEFWNVLTESEKNVFRVFFLFVI